MSDMADIRVEVLQSDQWGMRGLIRVVHIPTGAASSVPYAPGYGQHKARATAMVIIEMILGEVQP